MNKPVLFLRIAALLTFIHAVLHTIGGVFGTINLAPAQTAMAAMKANQFLFMGNMRSFYDFNRGLGLSVSTFLTAESIVFWLLASLARTEARRLRPILAVFVLSYVAFAVNSYVYFFLGAVITELLIAASLAAAFVTAKPAQAV